MQKVASILKSIGLQGSEISTYIVALERGPSTVIDLAKHSKLSRQATYTAIGLLEERGLMSSVLRGKKRFFMAEPPEKLLSYAKRKDVELHDKVDELERLMPELQLRVGGERPVVRVFEGKEGIKAIIQDMLRSPEKETYEITDLDAMHSILSVGDLKELRGSARRTGSMIYGIFAGKPGEGDSIVSDRHVFLPDEESKFGSNIGIYGNRLVCVTFQGKMYSVSIDSEPLVRTMRILFKYALKGLKK
ncbi:MAG: helix-turn-helix domain-containing protein [bacterium]